MRGKKLIDHTGARGRPCSPGALRGAAARVADSGGSRVALGLLLLASGALYWLRPRRVAVSGPSMEPTLRAGDRLLVVRGRPVKAGSVVALKDPNNSRRVIVKRVTAVRREDVIVRGDNPEASVDSRTFGPVPRSALLGTVVRRYAPAARAGSVR